MFTKLRQQIAQRRARRRAELNFVQTFDDQAKVESAIGKVDDYWRPRIDDVKSGPDNAAIPRVAGAGTILIPGWQGPDVPVPTAVIEAWLECECGAYQNVRRMSEISVEPIRKGAETQVERS